nr:MAG TPA: hypothetical protein [Bacteriophage sp.]
MTKSKGRFELLRSPLPCSIFTTHAKGHLLFSPSQSVRTKTQPITAPASAAPIKQNIFLLPFLA